MTTFRFLSFVFFLLMPICTAAQISDDFIVQVNYITADVDPPTVPSGVAAAALSTTEIDVSWSVSTDNVSVAGYEVFRDGAFLATTTLTAYSDTGLMASTSYDYTVRAFDTSFLFSSSSATATASTLAPPPVVATTTENSSRGGRLLPFVVEPRGWLVTVDMSTITITFTTDVPALPIVQWGETTTYELGYSVGDVVRTQHEIVLTDLRPDTEHVVHLRLQDTRGQVGYDETVTIRTDAGRDTEPPPNVSGLTASVVNEDVGLTWVMPAVSDIARVRVVTSDIFYPRDIADGRIVFDGWGTQVVDSGAAVGSGVHYYSVFVIDDSGNVSSGAVTFVRYSASQVVREPLVPPIDIEVVDLEPALPVLITQLAATTTLMSDAVVEIIPEEVFTIAIPYDALPEHLKTIVVTLYHPADANQTFSFLLTVNSDKTAYEATISPLPDSGDYVTNVTVYDFATDTVLQTNGVVRMSQTDTPVVSRDYYPGFVSGIIGLLLLLLVWYFGLYRQRAAEDN